MKPELYHLQEENEIISPALIYYKDILEENIQKLVQISGSVDALWPHIKSHKSADFVKLLMERGINRFKCATIAEGEVVGECGAKHAIISYPLVGPNIKRMVQLVKAYPETEFFAIGDDEKHVRLLSDEAEAAGMKINFLADINDGLNRTGVEVDKAGSFIRKVASFSGIIFRGMHVYDGHHHEADFSDRKRNVDNDVKTVYTLRDELNQEGYDCHIMVMGGTPSFPCHASTEGVFLSPGTCLIQDYGYASSFSDLPFEIGGMILTRVISRPTNGIFTVDLGYKAVAADPDQPRAVIAGYEDAITIMQNEEHWVLKMPDGRENECPEVGTVLYAAPKHICPTSALYPSILVAQNGKIIAEWEVSARNRKITI